MDYNTQLAIIALGNEDHFWKAPEQEEEEEDKELSEFFVS
jgi:hypothetical protein